MAMDRASELLTLGEMKEMSNVPSHKMVSHHVHKLVQVVVLFLPLSSSSLRFKSSLLSLVTLVVRYWVKPCTSLPNIWRTRRRPSWPIQKWRGLRSRLQGYGKI